MAKIKAHYIPPFTITSETVRLISEISETLGKISASGTFELAPVTKQENRLKSIQATLAIEKNSLSLEQVTAIINGKKVIGNSREIQEVKNTSAAYEMFENLDCLSSKNLLETHSVLMDTLVDEPGQYRSGEVGIMIGKKVVHIAPPATQVPHLMLDLFTWLKSTDTHPLIASSVFHYEFEFIHPFADGNGRMGRLWQMIILSKWRPLMAYLPVETVLHKRQNEYFQMLEVSDQQADSTAFVEFLLTAIKDALHETVQTDTESVPVNDHIRKLLRLLIKNSLTASDLMKSLDVSHRQTFTKSYLHPAIEDGYIEMTHPEKPNSHTQHYRITAEGVAAVKDMQ